MKNILLIAPPAGGKGTISEKLVNKYGYVHISTGELLRNTANEEIKEIMKSGKLVSDEIVVKLLKEKLSSSGDKPFVLDGFPRNINQAYMLDDVLYENGKTLDLVIEISVPYEEALKRVVNRQTCSLCGSVYNTLYKEPKVSGICDVCGEKLTTRCDDTEETYKERYNVYLESSTPLINYYKDKGMLKSIDGTQDAFPAILREISND